MILKQKLEFDSCHRLLNYTGNCNNCHGHTWQVEIEIESRRPLDYCGMLVDYRILKNYINENWDHRAILNENDPLVDIFSTMGLAITCMDGNPTAENIAKEILDDIIKIANLDINNEFDYCKVIVHESMNNSAEVYI